ncbi:hypothetical protein AYI68_g6604 [Smittium mucronatum]|uniref:Anoctamin transmembrane domain-containing protein n=1 Tax=Smittium mucronatum TaxID=133383 RepID=A0A1R0GR08_9FUNG|nr:hypothetical protein AYI68_g6604 [Smittium mucronatum]
MSTENSDKVSESSTPTTNDGVDFDELSQNLIFMENSTAYWDSNQYNITPGNLSSKNGSAEFKAFSDFVIVFNYPPPTKNVLLKNLEKNKLLRSLSKDHSKSDEILKSFQSIIDRLTNAGLTVEVRHSIKNIFKTKTSTNNSSQKEKNGSEFDIKIKDGHLLLFVTCSSARIELEYKKMLISNIQLSSETSHFSDLNQDHQKLSPASEKSILAGSEFLPSRILSTASRQRIVHRIISGPVDHGCANVRVDNEKYISAVFPLHDKKLNKKWIKDWSTKLFISQSDIEHIRLHFGEETAIYFAFLQFYFKYLYIPAILGMCAYLLNWQFSAIFSFLLMLWSLFFTNAWRLKQVRLAKSWGLPVSKSKLTDKINDIDDINDIYFNILNYRLKINQNDYRRSRFKPDHYVVDSFSGDKIPVYDVRKRFVRQLLSVPIILAFLLAMFLLVGVFFSLQMFMEEIYDGPFVGILKFLPTVLYSLFIPTFNEFCQYVSLKLTEFENYEYQTDFKSMYNQKIFTFRFLTDQGYLLLMAWVFIPLRAYFEAYSRQLFIICLTPLHLASSLFFGIFIPSKNNVSSSSNSLPHPPILKESSTPAAEKLQTLLIYLILTSQIINQVTSSLLPALLTYLRERKSKSIKTESDTKQSLSSNTSAPQDQDYNASRLSIKTDHDLHNFESVEISDSKRLEQAKFLYSVSEEALLVSYDVYEDYAELATQFGYISSYSVILPIAPLISLINNFFELRADAFKICLNVRKPVPVLTNSIGPWLETLVFTSWFGAIVNSLLVYQFNPYLGWLFPDTSANNLLKYGRTSILAAIVVAVVAEHFFLLCGKFVVLFIKAFPWLFGSDAKNGGLLKSKINSKILDTSQDLTLKDLGLNDDEIKKNIELTNSRSEQLGIEFINKSFKTE